MTPIALKLGLVAFALLSGSALVNMVVLQPEGGRGGAARSAKVTAAEGASSGKEGRAPPAKSATRTATDGPPAVERSATALPAGPRPSGERPVPSTRSTAARPASEAPPAAAEGLEVTRAIQRELKTRGYETGTADGQSGLVTRAAIMAYEHDRNLPLTGEPTAQLLKQILMGDAPLPAAVPSDEPRDQSVQATNVIRTVQQSLVTLGYVPGKVDGRMGADTVRAVRDFELDQGMPETGRISGQLVARLSRLAGQGRLTAGR